MWNAEFRLYLYPSTHKLVLSKSIKPLLSHLQLIGEPIPSQTDNRYATGDRFLSLLTFMGCSPTIELEPQDDKPHCYIEIEQRDSPCFISGANIKPAKCPHCKANITTLKNALNCPHCHKKIAPETLNWRKTAFYAANWITIGNIYELEAIPNDHLFTALEEKTGAKWKAAYIRHTTLI